MTENTDDGMTEFTRTLFADPETDPETETPPAETKPGNFVPNEGRNPQPRGTDHDLREFTAALFGREY